MKLRTLKATAALGSLTATVALLAGMSGAHAQGAPGAGSFPGSILLPGTQTSFKVGGYVKGDYYFDFSAQQSAVGGAAPNGAPVDGRTGTPPGAGHAIHSVSQMTASESRFNIETRTPTGYGELKTFIEGDFTNPSGLTNSAGFKRESDSSGFRLRLAYGTLGPWLVGQYPSLFRDSASEAETLDFGGALVAGATRQPQLRYTFDFGSGLTLAVAAENPQTFVQQGTSSTTFGAGQGDKIPDFTTGIKFSQPWGYVMGRGVVRDLYWHTGTLGTTTCCSASEVGWALGVSGSLTTFGKDNLFGQINGGDGGGRYINTDNTAPDAVVGGNNGVAANDIHTISAWSVSLGYQHWWTDSLRSTVVGSYSKNDNDASNFIGGATSAAFLTSGKYFWTGHVNLIWSPVPQVDTGIEWMRMQQKLENGLTGNTNRFQASTKFKF